jgi:hypothetical protein
MAKNLDEFMLASSWPFEMIISKLKKRKPRWWKYSCLYNVNNIEKSIWSFMLCFFCDIAVSAKRFLLGGTSWGMFIPPIGP